MLDLTLRYFSEVARLGSIRSASETLHVAPSAISRRVAILESQMEVELFERHPEGMRLTDAGQLLYEHTRRTSQEFERIRGEIDEIRGAKRGHIRIACVEGFLADCVLELIDRFRVENPGVTYSIHVTDTAGISNAILHYEADIGVAFNSQPHQALKVHKVVRQPLCAVYKPVERFARLPKSPSLSHIAALPHALPPNTGFGIRRLINQVALKSGIHLSPVIETNSIAALRELACRGLGVVVLPFLTVSRDVREGRLEARELVEEPLRNARMSVLVSNGRSLQPVARRFLNVTNSVLSSDATGEDAGSE